MSGEDRVHAPTAEEIEGRFLHPSFIVTRPMILAGLALLRAACRFGWSAEGVDRLDPDDQPLIFAANHCSHADTAAILGTLPRSIRRRTCVAAALDVFGPASRSQRPIKVVQRECLQVVVAGGFRAFAFDRQGPPLRSLRTATELIRRGWNLLLFPEGTRSRSGEIGPFKGGVGLLAKMTGRPVVPVHVAGGATILPCGATIPRPGHAFVRFSDPIHLEAQESAADFTARLRRRIRDLAPAGAAHSPAAALLTADGSDRSA
jgi:1-acyl-sn-glycerol-3-phosphate acyltransferase